MRRRSAGIGSFRKDATVFYDSESAMTSSDADRATLREISDPDAPYPRHAARLIENKFHFKTPVNVVLTTHTPERSFVRRLFEPDMADALSAWIKSPDVGFYEISYSWRKGDHTKQGKFNPDLFLRLADSSDVLVVELKDDGDDTDENKAKLLNAAQQHATYHIKFVSPQSYDAFFQALKRREAASFQSALQAALEN
jgi:type III restriction enzyme